jgi:hypothetical protein
VKIRLAGGKGTQNLMPGDGWVKEFVARRTRRKIRRKNFLSFAAFARNFSRRISLKKSLSGVNSLIRFAAL